MRKSIQRRQLLKASAASLPALPGLASAQSWPVKPIRLLAPFSPGGLINTMGALDESAFGAREAKWKRVASFANITLG